MKWDDATSCFSEEEKFEGYKKNQVIYPSEKFRTVVEARIEEEKKIEKIGKKNRGKEFFLNRVIYPSEKLIDITYTKYVKM